MHVLLGFALRLCPKEFRREYGDAIDRDVRARGLNPLSASVDVLLQGMSMRLENFWRDVVFGARSLKRTPVFTVVALLTILLAAGINITAFSILKGMLLDPLPYPHARRLVFVSATRHSVNQTNIDYPDVRDFARRNSTFEAISAQSATRGALTGFGPPVELSGSFVGGTYFGILGAKPELGRLLSVHDLGTSNLVISDALWRRSFDANPSVLGRRIRIDGVAYTVVGVAPAHLLAPGPGLMAVADYWIPIDPKSANGRGNLSFFAVGLLRTGVTLPQAQADLSRVASQIAREHPGDDQGVLVRPLAVVLRAGTRTLVIVLYCAALLVLLIAAANVTNLLLARTAARVQDVAVRSALGATRSQIAFQYVAEMAIVAFAGLAGAMALSAFTLHMISQFLTAVGQAYGMFMILPGWNRVGLNPGVVLYGAALTALFTMGTAMLSVYVQPGAARRAGRRLRAGLAACEMVLAFAVLVTAALLTRSFIVLEHQPTGFTELHTYSVQIDLPLENRYAGRRMLQFYRKAEGGIRSLPEVAAASEALIAGLSQYSTTNYSLDRALEPGRSYHDVAFNSVDSRFFRTLGIPLLAGRTFRNSDTATSQPVAIVGRRFAMERFGSIAAAIGKHVSVGESMGPTFPLRRIVGAVGDVRHSLSSPPSAEVYAPFEQISFPGAIVVRTRTNDPHLATQIDRIVAKLDPLLPAPHVLSFGLLRSIDDVGQRMAMSVFFALAAVSLLLALVGIYGVVAFNVQRRTHEFGIRMALGAHTSSIALDVLREAMAIAAVGIALGTVLAAVAARALAHLLYQTSSLDAPTYVGSAFVLVAALALSTLVPALRAMRTRPAVALRYE